MSKLATFLSTVLFASGAATLAQAAPAGPLSDPGGEGSRSAGTVIDDSVITAKVKAQLIDASGADANDVDVDTRAGVVQLTGTVSDESEAELAESIAAKVEGVEMVRNDLQVAGEK